MNCNYKVNIKDIQNKYKFNIFAMGGYNDSDLRKMIESVYYALPRVNGSGTNVTLTDTAFSYMKNKLYATDTSQESTSGYNLVDTLATNSAFITSGLTYSRAENGEISITGTSNRAWDYTLTTTMTFEAGKTYTFSIQNSGSTDAFIYLSLNANNGGSKTIRNNGSLTFTIVENQTLGAKISLGSGTTTNWKLKIMVEEGSTAHDYEPYTNGASPNPDYPQVIHTITGDNELIVSGKNKFNVNDFESQLVSGKILNDNGVEINDSGSTYSKYMIYLKANTTYHLKGYWQRIYYYNENKVFKSRSSSTNTLRDSDYTPTENEYIEFQINNATWSANKGQEQVELGSGSTYEAYKSNSVLLTLGDKEICKIGSYEDKIFKAIKGNEIYDSLSVEEKNTLDYGKWYLRKNVYIHTFDGTETLTTYGSQTNRSAFAYDTGSNLEIYSDANTVPNILCTHLIPTTQASTWKPGDISRRKEEPKTIYYVLEAGLNVTTGLQWLVNNNVKTYTPLATPTNELFNDTIQDQLEDIYNNMLSYEGQTNVSQVNEDLPFNINSTALKDLNNL